MANVMLCTKQAEQTEELVDPCVCALFAFPGGNCPTSPCASMTRAASLASTSSTSRSSGDTLNASSYDNLSMHTCSTKASFYSDLSLVTSGSVKATSCSDSTDCSSDTSNSSSGHTNDWGHVHDTPVCFRLMPTDE